VKLDATVRGLFNRHKLSGQPETATLGHGLNVRCTVENGVRQVLLWRTPDMPPSPQEAHTVGKYAQFADFDLKRGKSKFGEWLLLIEKKPLNRNKENA
jgi:hypothetical protein